ncbi:hypothetical protein BJ742DRAFT_862035 [Cladochytrium replicatum]|nr:hypothetical protein BJ742DRAFT_862035 [Cladochytrium replicatum]
MDGKNSHDQKNIVIIGGSFATAGIILGRLRAKLPKQFRIVIIEKHTHLHYMFAFPRAIAVGGFEEELFIPYDTVFTSPSEGVVITAVATKITPTFVELDRDISLSTLGPSSVQENTITTRTITYEYLILATGAKHPSPTNFNECDTKSAGVRAIQEYRAKIKRATSVLVCGGGAAGVEVAAEIREHYPQIAVTLVHSRVRYMPGYGEGLHTEVKRILDKYGVEQILGQRVVIPEGGFVDDGIMKTIKTNRGIEIECDLQILCTGLTPNSELIAELSPGSVDPITKFVRVKPTMQIADENFPNIFAIGDVNDFPGTKTARSAFAQSYTAARNILYLIRSRDTAGQLVLFGWVLTLGSWFARNFSSYNLGANRAWGALGLKLSATTKHM